MRGLRGFDILRGLSAIMCGVRSSRAARRYNGNSNRQSCLPTDPYAPSLSHSDGVVEHCGSHDDLGPGGYVCVGSNVSSPGRRVSQNRVSLGNLYDRNFQEMSAWA